MRLLLFLWLPACSTVQIRPEESRSSVAADGMEGLWVLQIRRQVWQPRDLEFVLRIEDDGSGTATMDPVFIGRTTAALSDLTADGATVRFSLHSKVDEIVYRFEATRDAGTLDGLVQWSDGKRDQTDPFTGHRRDVRRFDGGAETMRFRIEEDPQAVGVDAVLLDRLVLGAEVARSDALIVLADGRLVAFRTFGRGDEPVSDGSLASFLGSIDDGGAPMRPSDMAALGQQLVASGPPSDEVTSPFTVRPDPSNRSDRVLGFGHVTAAGEGLLVYPEAELVVVRTMERVPNRYDGRYDQRDVMEWLPQMADTLALEKLGR